MARLCSTHQHTWLHRWTQSSLYNRMLPHSHSWGLEASDSKGAYSRHWLRPRGCLFGKFLFLIPLAQSPVGKRRCRTQLSPDLQYRQSRHYREHRAEGHMEYLKVKRRQNKQRNWKWREQYVVYCLHTCTRRLCLKQDSFYSIVSYIYMYRSTYLHRSVDHLPAGSLYYMHSNSYQWDFYIYSDTGRQQHIHQYLKTIKKRKITSYMHM